ncbi:arylsulfatase [Mucilaginibacter yixingensis]|uniref:Arylsulfatase n=1 Tax=Mucilaginibacter yixingensis TaxID=1295612 RepID=A0A2T5JGE8_9SPHI|nr:arylsulfatase [Mucilaginibacter yixingensis]PTR01471.1 arylsulfatase [Mucilaginibacter yixingensis]
MKTIKQLGFVAALAGLALSASAQQNIPPSTPATYKGVIGKSLSESKEWWPKPIHAPAGAPNIVWILLDDVGFGASSTFGGLARTPNFDTLANNGLRYTNFHTAGICAPTRSSLLTGRNHHYVHMGNFAHASSAAGFPGYDGRIPADKGTIAEALRENGYSTFAVGKWGVTPDEDTTAVGPFDRWPTGKGFDHHFGFLESATDQYHPPHLVEDNFHVKPDGRNLNEQITDKAIAYIDAAHKAAPDKPFFLYYAPAATHAPHQVSHEWSDLYKGQFDDGWDAYREKVFANQKKLGVIPAYAQLPERNERIKAWNSLSPDQKKLYARFMEVYAGYLTYIDDQVGRVITYLKKSGQFDNTLVFVMIGDNGASKEGSLHGVISPGKNSPATASEDAYIKANENEFDLIGTPEASTNYPLGWAQAANTPFKYWKSDADAEGGTHNPLIVYYPKLIKEKGGIRTQYGHVSDIFPTTIEAAGLKLPEYVKGIKQDTLQGKSLYSSFNNAQAPSLHKVQYYYIFASRSIYKDGWKAEAAHHPDNVDFQFTGGKTPPDQSYDKDEWKLYDLTTDFNERNDLAKKYPQKLAELKALFDAEAKKNNIYPFISRSEASNKQIHHLENNQ